MNRDPAEQTLSQIELMPKLRADCLKNLDGLASYFFADAIARQNENV